MEQDLVIGLDSSTQSTKAVAWSRGGEAVAEGRADIPMATPQSGHVEQDIEDWWQATCLALKAVCEQVDPARIAGLAISNQRETVAFLDKDGRATHPAIIWLDERAVAELDVLTEALGAETLHTISGKPVDIIPVIYRLSWMRRHKPEVLARTAMIVDVHGFLTGRLTGTATASWTSADPFGCFDIANKEWSKTLLGPTGLTPEDFAPLARSGTAIGTITDAAAVGTGLATGTPVFAAGGDGQCAGLGVNAVRPGEIYLNLGTALITGAWSAEPLISLYWRTMTSPTGEGYFLEGAQRAGAFLLNWFVDTFAGGRSDPSVFSRLEEQAAALPIGSEGVTVCPYLTGCMDPHWDPNARASFNGMSPSTGLGHLYRAVLEAMTLESARSIDAMRDAGMNPQRIIAVGGGANSALWCRMYADATGLPLHTSESLEASSLGAGITAAVGAGWFPDFDVAASAMSGFSDPLTPEPAKRAEWDALSTRQAAAYRPGNAS